jgi:hypothetical protein
MIQFMNTALAAVIDTSLPGPYDISKTGPVGAIGNIYYFAMALGGFLAFASIVYAGIKWTASRGNSSTISDAKDQITQALIGLLLLMGSFIVLNTINPQLTILKFPELTKIEMAAGPPGGGGASLICSNENPTATCPISFDECKPDAGGNYGCRLKANLIWVCRQGATVKYCHRPGNSEAGSGKAICNSNCQALTGADCNGAPEQNTGQCQGAAN